MAKIAGSDVLTLAGVVGDAVSVPTGAHIMRWSAKFRPSCRSTRSNQLMNFPVRSTKRSGLASKIQERRAVENTINALREPRSTRQNRKTFYTDPTQAKIAYFSLCFTVVYVTLKVWSG